MQLEVTDTRTLTDETPDVREMEFHNSPISVGAHSANTLQLPAPDIQPYHAMILPMAGDAWVFQPTGPDAKCLINDEPVAAQVELEDGDVIAISHFSIRFKQDAAQELVLPEAGNLDELVRIKDFPLPPRSDIRRLDADITLSATRQAALATFGLNLRSCMDIAHVLEVTLDLLLPELGARTVWIGARRQTSGDIEQVAGRSDKGPYHGEPYIVETFKYRCLNRHQFIIVPKAGTKEIQSILAVPIMADRGALGLIVADTHRRTRVFDDADRDFMTMVSRMVANQLDAIINVHVAQKAQMAATELAFLREVQSSLDPTNVPMWPQLHIAAFAKPGVDRAGDFYDIMQLPNGLASMMMGHVESTTTRAALAMAEARSAYRFACLHADPPHVQLRALNWLLYNEKVPCKLHIAIIVMNPKTGKAELGVAGNMGAVIVDARGNPRKLSGQEVGPVGSAKAADFSSHTEGLRNGETLAFFTPGCWAVRNEEGESLGEERFVDALCDGFGQPASAAIDELLADHAGFFKRGTPPDDITMLLVHRAEPGTH
jgi:serine phosphatase RsbU (regulator of sigma subunit)